MGPRYVGYRLWHELEKRSGLLKRRHPIEPPLKNFISLEAWRANTLRFVIREREQLDFPKLELPELKEQAAKIFQGEVLFFNHQWRALGADYDWITNPDSGYCYDISKHWSQVSDLNPANGDIKFVWEKSRFTYLLTIIRKDYHFAEDHSEFVLSEIENWIQANPINQGPNWRCSQEISLRLFNWCYALYFYKNSPALTEERWQRIQNVIYWSLHHVYHHINFSRIAVRNNHAITETLMLTLSELLFPFIPETKRWAQQGRKWFEQEVAYQIYEDGTFLQFSMNYHRVVVQLLTLGISLTEIHNKPFSKTVYDRSYKSLNFLYQNTQDDNGYLPNYGSNDGALFFPLSSTGYNDYRPQLNALHHLLTGKDLYTEDFILENRHWIGNGKKFENGRNSLAPLKKLFGTINFPIGGYYLLREEHTFTFIRCGNHKDRPAHADNLHLDIWVDGENILRDSGTYQYNTDNATSDYFTGTASHNTVMVENHSQMLKGSRFIWYYWSQAENCGWKELTDRYVFKGKIRAFRHLNPKARHTRTIIKFKDQKHWQVVDQVDNLPGFAKIQLWHHDGQQVSISAVDDAEKQIEPKQIASHKSLFYGHKEAGKGTGFTFANGIKTDIFL